MQVTIITPFNFPLEIPVLQLMGALYMGNKPTLKVDSKVCVGFLCDWWYGHFTSHESSFICIRYSMLQKSNARYLVSDAYRYLVSDAYQLC